MSATAVTPGLRVTVERRGAERSALRSDVAGFVGPTRRGPVWAGDPPRMVATRVEGWREFVRTFGGEIAERDTPSAVRGYFQNGGEIAYVTRVETSTSCARGRWKLADRKDPALLKNGFAASEYEIVAANPGLWANGTRVSISYRRDRLAKSTATGSVHRSELDIVVEVPGETPERLLRLTPDGLAQQVAERSLFVRLLPKEPVSTIHKGTGPRAAFWEVVLGDVKDGGSASEELYRAGIGALSDEPEVALLVAPDLFRDAPQNEDAVAARLLALMMGRAEEEHDRLVVADLPPWVILDADPEDPKSAQAWRNRLASEAGPTALRSAAVYHPSIQVRNPLGGTAKPLRDIPPSGHVAGVISWLDRVRGAHHTPANAIVYGALDVATKVSEEAEVGLRDAGVNPIRCAPGRGLVLWGGRTLLPREESRSGIFVAHRRLVHRLVRAIRLAASPLVFDANGPELWLAFVRAVTSVLLDAFRAGALKGTRPEQGFRVRCDEQTNPPSAIDNAQCVCEIEIAPAVPMEFILIRLALTTDGSLNLVEA